MTLSIRAAGLIGVGAACLSLLAANPSQAWWPKGHAVIARGALKALPAEVPAFFRGAGELVGHLSYDPDVQKNRATPTLRAAEDPEHYLDFELLQGKPLPKTRYDYYRLCSQLKVDPTNAGTVPYSITEWTEKLTVAFAEHRKWPTNMSIQTKCQFYAGILAHYAGDVCMPLHTTIHFDGRAGADGKSPRSGIHARLDSLIERLDLKPEQLAMQQKPAAIPDLFAGVMAQIENSRSRIDRSYELEPRLPPQNEREAWTPNPEAREFGIERGRESVRFLASLYLTAWKNSEKLPLPSWLQR